ncbi:aminoacyl-tRNA hydrolase [Thalassoglobus polymorphus]|uniref:Peptidyl-tRNA hydrolase n=1 Tax=Thalassoglobus polymorphus TaxID=2527994 RepID=A0A517QRX6_9PLAN|nr:aminoacyl-tRNA hydrolase [Thalassoglobus polymorphus]QDT34386.1 Peptidyl-tRNA hydrolase [Thalassoglobus polymorphus]
MKIVVGLGNPGKKYVGTRHNIGFDVLAVLAQRFSADRWKSSFEAEVTDIQIGSERVVLVAPQTFMNLSGRSVRAVVKFYKVSHSELLLVHDDMNLPTGRLRLRGTGSAGGQKGLQNTIDQLGTSDFARLRVGVGRPPGKMDAANYVLQKFSKSEFSKMEHCVERAASAVECWVQDGVEKAMNEFNQTAPEDGESL